MAKLNLLVMAHSEPWCSAVARFFPDARRVWVLNMSDLAQESVNLPNGSAIVEIPAAKTAEFCVELAEFLNNANRLKIFAVGDAQLASWQPALQAAGVASCCWSFLQFPNLVKAIHRHADAAPAVNTSTKTELWNELPWRPKL